MAVEPEPINPENVFDANVSELAMDSRFGSLVFDNANKKLSKVQDWLKEAHDLGYKEVLLQDDINRVDSFINQLAQHLEWLRIFDIGAVENAKLEHDQFETRVDAFFNNAYTEILKNVLQFLREERRRENPSGRQTDEELKKLVKLRTDLEAELKNVREETEKLRIAGKDVGAAKGERAATRLASHFDQEAGNYKTAAGWWFWAVVAGYVLLIAVLGYLTLVAISSLEQVASGIQSGSNLGLLWTIGITKLVFVAALWYGLSFIVKNHNVNSHLAAVNRHRATVARTLEDFIAVEQQQEKPRLSEMLQNATDAMFKHTPVGFVSKTEKETATPVLQIVNDLIGVKNQS